MKTAVLTDKYAQSCIDCLTADNRNERFGGGDRSARRKVR
jgi:hypothetical protein